MSAGEVLPDISACRELASVLRAGDDSAAAGLAARAGIPRWLLTHPELGPRGRLDAGEAGEALGCISVLAAGRAVTLAPWLAKPGGDRPGRGAGGGPAPGDPRRPGVRAVRR